MVRSHHPIVVRRSVIRVALFALTIFFGGCGKAAKPELHKGSWIIVERKQAEYGRPLGIAFQDGGDPNGGPIEVFRVNPSGGTVLRKTGTWSSDRESPGITKLDAGDWGIGVRLTLKDDGTMTMADGDYKGQTAYRVLKSDESLPALLGANEAKLPTSGKVD